MSVEQLREERGQITRDTLDGIIPKRVLCSVSISQYALAEMSGIDPRECYWAPEKLEPIADELCNRIHSDGSLMGFQVLQPSKYQGIGSKSIIMSSSGMIQHPNTHMLEPEEWDEFIEDPYAFIVEKAIPRENTALNYAENPSRIQMAMTLSDQACAMVNQKNFAVQGRLSAKYGYFPGYMGGGGGYAPMDILSDELRSFSGMLTDVRRHRDKVIAAVEAISPANYLDSHPADMSKYTRYAYGFYPFHMATFMREKDFADIWWPSLKRQWDGLASEGIRSAAFLEHDWTRLLDYVADLPTGSLFTFELTDPVELKKKLGKKMILSSGFPIEYLSQVSAEEAADKTKEWLDIMAVDGNYMFGLNKGILVAADVKVENLEAVVNTVLEYGQYGDQAGKKVGEEFHKEDYKPANLPEFKSRAFKTWEQYLEENPNTPESAKDIVMAAEVNMLHSYFALLK